MRPYMKSSIVPMCIKQSPLFQMVFDETKRCGSRTCRPNTRKHRCRKVIKIVNALDTAVHIQNSVRILPQTDESKS